MTEVQVNQKVAFEIFMELVKTRPTVVATELAAALAEPVQEPVCDKDPRGCYSVRCQLGKVCKNAAPPQRKPLTEEEIKQLLFESAGMTVTFSAVDLSLARAIERAHGIGVNK